MPDPITPPATPPATPPSGGEGGTPPADASSFKSFMQEKNFKSEDDAVKYFKDLETKHNKTVEESEQYRKYYPYALAFSSYLKANPDALENYKKWSEGSEGDDDKDKDKSKDKGDDNPNPVDTEARTKADGLVKLEADRVVQTFQDKWGISKLPDDKYNDLAGRMGATLRSWGIDLAHPTIDMVKFLNRHLEDAYALVRMEDAKKEGKTEAFMEAEVNSLGRIPSIPTEDVRNPDDINENNLTEAEKQVAAKMHLTPKEYADNKKEILKKKT